jgi:hypothetical protein
MTQNLVRHPIRRLVLLGASNLRRALGTAVAVARRIWGAPLDVLAAAGHGRSYGLQRGVPWRILPGIVECDLWAMLAQRPPAPTAAIVTDVGNDLLYDVPVATVADWVEQCVDRLLEAGAGVTMTALPLCSLHGMSAARFLFLRSLLFPGCRLSYSNVLERARELDLRLRGIAEARSLPLVEHRSHWYGVDPIHIRWRHLASAWHEILTTSMHDAPSRPLCRCSFRSWLYFLRLAPAHYWFFGRERQREQPCGVLEDGTTVSLC